MSPRQPPREAPRLPALGEPVSGELSTGSERRFGELIMRDVRRDRAYLDDPLLLDHVQRIWGPLLRAARERGEIVAETDEAFAWQTFLVQDRSVNAFALPGGFVGVHLGLIAITSTADELAAVLAHELSHVTQRHIARGMSSAQKQSMVGMAAMILGVIAASRANNADLGQAAVIGSQAAMIQGQLNFSRDMEREADRIGFQVFADAGYAPQGMSAMFEKLDQANRLNDSGAFPYLRSHPLTVDRIGEARARLEGPAALPKPVVVAGPMMPSPAAHRLMQARARVLMDSREIALRRWTAAPSQDIGSLYAATLSHLKLREVAAAQLTLSALELQLAPLLQSTSAPPDTQLAQALALLRADWQRAAGQPLKALAELAQPGASAGAVSANNAPSMSTTSTRTRPTLLARTDAALEAFRAMPEDGQRLLREQLEALQLWVSDNRFDALAWSQISACTQQLGQNLRSVRADAESRAALGDLNGALDRLRAAQRLARSSTNPDHVEASIVDTRVREVERQRRRVFAEIRGIREEDLPPVLPPNLPI